MARTKGTKVQEAPRLTLAEIKAQEGKYTFVDYRGTMGGWALPAPRPRFAGDTPKEIFIKPFSPQQIGDEWLDDPTFGALYEKEKGIRVWKADIAPAATDLESDFPPELAEKLSPYVKSLAYLVAMTDSGTQLDDIINVHDRQSGANEALRFQKNEVLPFLKAVQYYEKRLMNRPDVMKKIETRLRAIIDARSPLESVDSF